LDAKEPSYSINKLNSFPHSHLQVANIIVTSSPPFLARTSTLS
jgi:hypothetical protein